LLGERVGEQVTEVERGGLRATTLTIGGHALTREEYLLGIDRNRVDLVEHEQPVDLREGCPAQAHLDHP
jgi:hypothetical protein